MKELTSHIHPSIAIHAQKEVAKQKQFLGSLKLHKGQTCYEMNIKTGVITKAEYSEVKIDTSGAVIKTIITKENCLYLTAINEENASRKFMQSFNNQQEAMNK